MATIAIALTNTDQIRAVLGCDINDLPDDMLVGRQLDLLAYDELAEVYSGYEDPPNDIVESRLALWCMYFCALAVIEDAPLALRLKEQLNNDQMQRFPIDFEALKRDLRVKLARLAVKLNSTEYAVAPTLISKVAQDYNVITGE